jgi:hypothetical protein
MESKITEGSAQAGCQYKEHHDGSVHRNKRQIKFRVKLSFRIYPSAQKGLSHSRLAFREAKLQTEDYRKNTTQQCPENSGNQELLSNYFMVLTENIVGPEITFVMLMLIGMCIVVNVLVCMNCCCHLVKNLN